MFLGTRHVPSPKTTFNLASVLHRAGTKRKAIVEGPNKLHEFWLRSARDVLDALPSYALRCGYYHGCPLPVETVVATPLLHRRQTARFEGDDRTDVPGPLRSDDKRCKAPKKTDTRTQCSAHTRRSNCEDGAWVGVTVHHAEIQASDHNHR